MAESEPSGLRLLVLDGGDIRCLSQLTILEEFLHQVQWKKKSHKDLLPRDYFHMIVGTGPAGIIVVLLVVFQMSVQEAKDEFVRIWVAVFVDDYCKPEERSAKLERMIKDLLRKRNMPSDRKLLHGSGDEACKAVVCAISPSSPASCQKFRTYRSSQRHIDVSIVEAIRATCATPDRFTSLKVNPRRREGNPATMPKSSLNSVNDALEFIAGDSILQNPTREAIKELYDVFGGNQWVSCILSLGCGRPGILHIDTFKESPGNGLHLITILQSERVADELDSQLGGSQVYYRLSVDHGLESPNISVDNLGIIEAHTKAYLQQATTIDTLNRCFSEGELPGRITTRYIYCIKVSTPPKIYGLPPRCASFVTRQDLLDSMNYALFRSERGSQHFMVLSGMGGSGKTQMVTHFAQVYSFRFRFILFIDASTKEKIEQGIRAAIRFMGDTFESLEDAITFLDHPDRLDAPYLLVFDNADDPRLDLAPYLPRRGHGYIIITTRNPTHGNLAPKAHIRVDIMSEAEALEALSLTVFSSSSTLTSDDQQDALAIIQELDYLPVAVVQAGSYIKQQSRGRMRDYLQKLRTHRHKLLSIPAKSQLDFHHHAIYATLDITLDVLSTQARDFLGILACFNYTGFPLPLIDRAATRNFVYEPFELFDRPPEFTQTVELLTETFDPTDMRDLDVLAELEQFSLVARVKNYSMTILRFHPLTHAWISDRVAAQDEKKYRDAAMRLFTCGMSEEDEDLFEYLRPHLTLLCPTWNDAHWNDLAAIARLRVWSGDREIANETWRSIHAKASQMYGDKDHRSTTAKLQLAMAVNVSTNWEKGCQEALEMIKDAVAIRSQVLPLNHPYTLDAINILSEFRTIKNYWISDQDLASQIDVVKYLQEYSSPELCLLELKSVETLVKMYKLRSKWSEAETLLLKVIRARVEMQGPYHWMTLRSKELLALTYLYSQQHRYTEYGKREKSIKLAEEIQKDLITHRMKSQGPHHADTLEAQQFLGKLYDQTGQNDLAVVIRSQVVEGYKATKSPHDEKLLHSMGHLVSSLESSGKSDEAIVQWQEIIGAYMAKKNFWEASHAVKSLARLFEREGRCGDAVAQWDQLLEERNTKGDNWWVLSAMESLAELLERLGRWDDFVTRCDQWIAEWRAEGNIMFALEGTNLLAKWLKRTGRYNAALDRWQQIIKEVKAKGETWCIINDAKDSLAKLFGRMRWYDDAVAQWDQLIEERNAKDDDFLVLQTMGSLAKLLEGLGRYDDLVARCDQWIEGWKAKDDSKHTIQCIGSLASFLERIGRDNDAVDRWKQLIETCKEESDSRLATKATESLAKLFERMEHHDDAMVRWDQCIKGAKATSDNLRATQTMKKLAKLLERMGRYEDAIAQWEQVIEGWKTERDNWQATEVMDTDTKRFKAIELFDNQLRAVKSLAELLERMGRYEDAIAQWEQVIEGWKTEGDNKQAIEDMDLRHMLLEAMESFSGLLERIGRHYDAVIRWEQVIEWSKATGNNWWVKQAMKSLAMLLERMGRKDDAVTRWEQMIEGLKATNDNDEAYLALESLARLLEEMGHWDDAVARWEQVIEAWKPKDDHWQDSRAIKSLSGLLKRMGRYGDAVVRWDQWIERLKATSNNGEVHLAMESLIWFLEKMGHCDDAVARWEQWIEEWKATGSNWETIKAMKSLAKLLERMGRNDDAVTRWEQWIEEGKAAGDEWQTNEAMGSFAELLERMGRKDDAVARWDQWIETLKGTNNNWHAITAMRSFSRLLERMERHGDAVVRWDQMIEGLKVTSDNYRAHLAIKSLARLLEEMGRYDDAVARWEGWMERMKAGHNWSDTRAIKSLVELLEKMGRHEDAKVWRLEGIDIEDDESQRDGYQRNFRSYDDSPFFSDWD